MEKKKWTLDEIEELQLEIPRGFHETVYDDRVKPPVAKWANIRQYATDYYGSHIVRVFKKVDDHWEETDVKAAIEEMADYLKTKVSSKTIIKEVLAKAEAPVFFDLLERIEKEPKVTVSIQKGSCVTLRIRGKRGRAAELQLTE